MLQHFPGFMLQKRAGRPNQAGAAKLNRYIPIAYQTSGGAAGYLHAAVELQHSPQHRLLEAA
jgi:hypothetical protein